MRMNKLKVLLHDTIPTTLRGKQNVHLKGVRFKYAVKGHPCSAFLLSLISDNPAVAEPNVVELTGMLRFSHKQKEGPQHN